MNSTPPILLVTGKLAEPALRRVVAELTGRTSLQLEVTVLPITVAALLTTDWVARKLPKLDSPRRVILPGYCRGELDVIPLPEGSTVEKGPRDVVDLPSYLGQGSKSPPDLSAYSIEILAEINHAPSLTPEKILALAEHYRQSGANIIDLGCDPAGTWEGIGSIVALLKKEGFRVSVDSFNPIEVEKALAHGAELVLSVNEHNSHLARSWYERYGAEVVAIPNTPNDLDSLDRTREILDSAGVPFRLDPILEPIGFGFAPSLGRYLATRQRYPNDRLMMGIGNLTELTDVDSAGVNVLLAGFCQEIGIGSVLTTEVINWCRSAVREFDVARRLVHYSVTQRVLPKHLDPRLIMLRDIRLSERGEQGLRELAEIITDRNYRIFAERGEIHILNGQMYLHGKDPFEIFEQLQQKDSKLDPSHAFYLGYEMAKAVTALTLGKQYTQDQALDWGMLTVPEISHRQ
jgi:dihydropteroate synthase-like protein